MRAPLLHVHAMLALAMSNTHAEAQAGARGLPHMPALDGLRGLAVVGVVWFHLGGRAGSWMKGGYLGVDLFFVLSGYLITLVLLAERDLRGSIDLKQFWIRRARRLTPALLSLMPAIVAYARWISKPAERGAVRLDALATLAYIANWRAVFANKSYWELFAAPSPLEHTWSLAIEEQFYLIWPLLFLWLACKRKLGTNELGALALVAALSAGAAMVWAFAPGSPNPTTRAYFGTDTRSMGILLGAALACFRSHLFARIAPKLADLIAFAGMCVLAWSWTHVEGTDARLYRGGFLVTELACLGVIFAASYPKPTWSAKLLSAAPLRWAGLLSYGVYLWHWPVFCALTPERTLLGEPALIALRLALTLAIAVVSYFILERPIRLHGLRLPQPALCAAGFLAATVALVACGIRADHAGARRPVPGSFGAPQPPSALPAGETGPRRLSPWELGMPELPKAELLPAGTLRVLTVGDSVSQKLGFAMRIHQDSVNAFVGDRGVGDCSIMESLSINSAVPLGHPNPASGCAANWVHDAHELKPDLTLIVLGGAYLTSMMINGHTQTACASGWQTAYRARLQQLLDDMGKDAGQVAIVLVPYPGERWIHGSVVADVECFNQLLKRFASERKLPTVDVFGQMCGGAHPRGECRLVSAGEPIRPDGLHPECPGADILARWTLGELRAISVSKNP